MKNTTMQNKDNIEKEIKFLVYKDNIDSIKYAIKNLEGVEYRGRVYEKTTMFDDDSKHMGQENARLRLRKIGEGDDSSCHAELSYKRRLESDNNIKKEEEIEITFDGNTEHLIQIINKMGYKQTTSYERYRSTYMYDGSQITLDEFPFGYILEIEGEEDSIYRVCKSLKLDENDSSLDSCDDIYESLCKKNNTQPSDHILFSDQNMPYLS